MRKVGFEKCKNASDRAWILDDEKEVSRELNLPNSTKNPEGILGLKRKLGRYYPSKVGLDFTNGLLPTLYPTT